MPDNVTNELLLDTLKAIQSKLADIACDVVGLKADMRGMQGHMAALMQSEVARVAAPGSHSIRTAGADNERTPP